MIKAVIFDFDGVLVDSLGVANDIFFRAIKEHLGLEHDLEEFVQMPGKRFEERIRLIGKKFNIAVTEKQILQIMKQGIEEYRAVHLEEVLMYPGAKALIKKLNETNFKIGLGTNGSRQPVIQKVEHLDIKKYFSSIVTADDVSALKPDPEMFLRNAAELGANPDECVVIEDSLTGIQAAKAAGIKVIAVETTLSKELLKEADFVVEKISDISLETIRKLEA